MEDRERAPVTYGIKHGVWQVALLLGSLSMAPQGAYGRSLDQQIPGLFGGTLNTTIQPGISESRALQFSNQFRSLSAALAAARSQAPVPSASGAFRFAWDTELDTFVRMPLSLGPILAERAQTLGRGTATVGVSYTRIDFDTFEGRALSNLSFSQQALSPELFSQLPPDDQERFGKDELQTRLDLHLAFDLFFFTAAYGLTDTIDVSLALAVNRAVMHGTATTTIESPHGADGTVFVTDADGSLVGPSGQLCMPGNLQCATDSFDDSAFGTGDLFLRAKWHLADTRYADLAFAGVLTLPTGNADDFLGFHDPTFTPTLIASKSFGRVSPHLNVGYAFRSSEDVSQAEWIAGTDVRAVNWLTLNADFLGFHDDKRDGINDDVLQAAVGFKINPIDQLVVAAVFQFPLNRDGLRADVIYTGQVEYTF
jgi:hypothetical protein